MPGDDIRYLSLVELLEAQAALIKQTGGLPGVRDLERINVAAEHPRMYLYEGLPEKAAALGFLLVSGHGFVDGNKRIAVLAMHLFLERNGYQLIATHDELYDVIMNLAGEHPESKLDRETFTEWLRPRLYPAAQPS